VVYGLGCGTSMSLISTAAFLLGILTLVESILSLRMPTGQLRERLLRLGLALGLAHTLYLTIFTLATGSFDELRAIAGYLFAGLLFLYPLSSLRPKFSGGLWRTIVIATFAGSAVAVGLAVWQRFGLGEVRVFGKMRNPVIFAYSLLPALVYFGITRRGMPSRILALGLYLAILLTGSRTAAVVGLLVLTVGYLPMLLHPGRRTISVGLLFGTLLIGVWQIQGNEGLRDRTTRLFRAGEDRSFSGRVQIWRLNQQYIRENPIFGLGPRRNALDIDMHPELTGVLSPGSRGIFAHNIFLQTLAESGIVGFVLFFGFQLVAFCALPVLRPYFLVTWIAGLTDTPFTVPRMYYPLYFFLILAVFTAEREESA